MTQIIKTMIPSKPFSFIVVVMMLNTVSPWNQVLANDGVEESVIDNMNVMMDAILQDITGKYQSIQADEFWHPYVFGTGNINREVIHVNSMEEHHIPGDFIQWKMSKMGLTQYMFGMTISSVEMFNSQLQKLNSTDIPMVLNAIEVFTRWDAERNSPVMIIFVATSEPNIIVFKSMGQQLDQIGAFALHFKVKSLSMCRVNNKDKLLMVPENSDSAITLYNIDILADEVQLWFSQRFVESGYKSTIVHQPDTTDSVVIVAHPSQLNIYAFDTATTQFNIQQVLPLQKACGNMLPFTIMYQHYIACLTNDSLDSVQFISYNYNMNEYEEKETFNKIPASDLFPIAIEGSSSRDDSILMVRAADGDVNVLAFDGQNEFKSGHKCSLDACTETSSFNGGTSFVFDGTSAYVLPTRNSAKGAPVIVLFTNVQTRPSPVFEQSVGLFNEFKTLSHQMNLWRHVVTSAEDTLKRKLNKDGDNVITGDWNVQSISTKNLTIEGRDANSEDVFNLLKFGDVEWTEEDFASTNDEIMSQMNECESSITLIKEKLGDALLISSQNKQVVISSTSMLGSITVNNANVNKLKVDTVWRENTDEFLSSLAHKDLDTLNVQGGLIFTEHSTTKHLDAVNINEVVVDNLARLSSDNIFQCPTHFENIQALKNIDATLVNQKNLLDSVVMIDDVSELNFVDGIVAFRGAETIEQYPFDNLLLKSAVQTVLSTIAITDMDVLSSISVEHLNEKNFSDYISTIITKDHKDKILGEKTIEGDTNLTALFISAKWNQKEFPHAFPSSSDEIIVLNGAKSFSKLVAEKMTVDQEVDGILTQNLVSLSETDVLNSVWNCKGKTKILENMMVDRTVDGVFIESLVHTGTLNEVNDEYHPDANIVFEQPIILDNLNVQMAINGKTFSETFHNLILFEGSQCKIHGKTIITGDAFFDDMQVFSNNVNGFSIENFLTKDTPQIIASDVTFSESVFFDEIYSLEHFDDVRVQDVLERALRVSESTTTVIPWDIHFESIKCQNNLRVEGPINDMANYGLFAARARGPIVQTFTGPIVISNPKFANLSTTNLVLEQGHTIQNVDIFAWNQTRAKLSEPASFSKPFSVNKLTVKGNIDTENINGISVHDLHDQVFRSDGEFQEFSGHITMKKGLRFEKGDVQFHTKVDGFNLNDVIKEGLRLHSEHTTPIIINADWQFESLKIEKEITSNGKVCGVDLRALQLDSVTRGEPNAQIFAEKSFTQPLLINGSITSPHIGSQGFLENVFLLHENQTIQSHTTFSSNIFNDMIETDSINSLPVLSLSKMYIYENGQHVLNHNVLLSDSLKSNSMVIGGTIQDGDLNQFLSSAFKKSDKNIVFSEEVTMQMPIISNGKIQTILYNGINVDELFRDVVQLHEVLVVRQPVKFTKSLRVLDSLSVAGNLSAIKFANGLDWNDVTSNAIRIDDDNSQLNFEDVHFEHIVAFSPVSLETLNGKPFEHYATTNSEQNLGTLKISQIILDASNVNVNGRIGTFDISEEFEDTLMNNKPELQRISGETVIQGPVHILQDIQCFGSQFQKEIISTHEDFEIDGPVEFTKMLTVQGDVHISEPIQGHTVESIFDNVFNTENTQLITENWDFRGPVTFEQNVSGQGMLEGLNIQSLVEEKDAELRDARSAVDIERRSFQRECHSLRDIRNDIAASPLKLDSFDFHQVIALKTEATNVLPVGNDDKMLLFVQTTNCQQIRYHWQQETELFQRIIEDDLSIGNVESWQSVPDNGEHVMVWSKSPSGCSKDSGLSFLKISSNGDLSSTDTISEKSVKSFKLLLDEKSNTIVLFVLFHDQSNTLDVFRWDLNQFVDHDVQVLNTSMDRIEAVETSSGLGIVCHNTESLYTYEYSIHEKKVVHEVKQSVLASITAPLAVFENFGLLYAVVPESGTSPSLMQPNSNFQVMRVMDASVQSVQKLQIPDVISATQWSFAGNPFITFQSKSNGLLVYKFSGLNGFELIGAPYKSFGGRMLKFFSIQLFGFSALNPFMLSLSSNSIEIYRGNVLGDTLIADFEALCNS